MQQQACFGGLEQTTHFDSVRAIWVAEGEGGITAAAWETKPHSL